MLRFIQRTLSQQPAEAPILIYAILGMTKDATDALRRIMTMMSGRTRHAWQLGTPAEAAVVILGPRSDATSEALHGHPYIARVTLSDDSHFGDVTRLEYPFRVFQVLSALQEIESRLSSSDELAPLISRNSSWALFDSLCQLASQASQGRWLVTHQADGRALHVRDDLRQFAADASLHAELMAGSLPPKGLSAGEAPDPALPMGGGRELLWHVGLHSGRGNLSGSLDAGTAYRLLAWPDFGVVRPQRAHLRMSALLAAIAYSRDELHALLEPSADIRVVNHFLNACAASGLLQAERRETAVPMHRPAPAVSSFVSGLVASIRDKLGF